jgi:serine/threonine protein kinase
MTDKKMASSLEGQTLGKYQILEPLGRGGMARVYRAYHPKLDRYAAIKVLRSDLVDDEEFLARFRQEAKAIAALRHPNIIQVYDFDVEGDYYYIVLELLEGDSLKVRLADYQIRNQRMPWGEMVRILLDSLDGLAYAHHEGMIHRDIKPANILLSRRGQAVLGDFGIAQIVGGTRHTATGAMMGTLNYMAPEQGLENKCDARSDIYSMGIVFYEMLTRRTPFEADTPLAILMKHLNDPLPLPRQLDPAIPEPFERVVLKALAKAPDDRHQSAEAMARALVEAADEAWIELPDRISLPMSFTTDEAPAESVAVFSGTARERLDDLDFADDDTDASLGHRLEQEMAKLEPGQGSFKELWNAALDIGRFAMGEAAHELRKAADEERRKARERRAQYENPAPPAGQAADEAPPWVQADWGRHIEKKMDKLEAKKERLQARQKQKWAKHAERVAERAAKRATRHSEPCEPGGCCGGTAQSIVGGIGLIVMVNVLAVWLGTTTDNWVFFEIGWPVELLLVSMALCMVMIGSGAIWLLIPVGILFGNGVLFTYYSLTQNWEHWAFLWPLEPLLIVITVWFTVLMAGRGNFSCRLARFLGMVLWLAAAGIIACMFLLIWPWFYDAALEYYQFGLDVWSTLQ